MKYWLTIFASIINLSNINAQTASEDWSNEFEIVGIKSPIDGVLQKAYFYKTKSNFPQPLIVSYIHGVITTHSSTQSMCNRLRKIIIIYTLILGERTIVKIHAVVN